MRLVKVMKALALRFKAIDPDLLTTDMINGISPQLAAVYGNVQNYAQNKNFGHIDNANNHADQILAVSRAITATPLPEDVHAIIGAAATFYDRSTEYLLQAKNSVDELQKQIAAQQAPVEAGRVKLEENNKVIEQQKGRLDLAISAIQQQAAQAEAQRGTDFAATIAKINEQGAAREKDWELKFTNEKDERLKRFESEIAALKKRDEEHSTFLNQRQAEVNKIFGAIGSASLSGHFAKTADADATAANWLRGLALLLMGAMIAVGGYTYYYSLIHENFDWKIFGFRLATTIIVAIPAVYAAQESSKHRERERRNRTLQLELASIDAYLSLLPITKQHELKEKLTEHFFGRTDIPEKSDDVTKHALFEIIKTTVSNLTKNK